MPDPATRNSVVASPAEPAFTPVPGGYARRGAMAFDPDFVRGALFVIAAEFLFVVMGASIRVAAEALSNPQIVFFRNFVAVLILAPWLLHGGIAGLRTRVPHLHLLRGLAGLAAMYCFFYAIANMPLAEAMLLKLSAPLFIPVAALLILAEPVPVIVRWGLLLGFTGVAVILRPDLSGLSPVALIALLGGAFAALAKVMVRKLSKTEPATRIVFYFAVTGTVVSALPLFWYWRAAPGEIWPWLGAIGIFATLGQLLLTRGFGLAPAARMGTFSFFSVVFGAAFGWMFWDEVLRWTTVAGTLLIVLAGMTVSRAGRNPLRDLNG